MANTKPTPPGRFTSESARAAAQKAHENKKAAAQAAREAFLATIAGAKVRVAHVPRPLITETAFAVTNLMLAKILTGELVVTNAKEAAMIAKMALDIGRLEIGDPASNTGELTPEERDRRIEAAKELRKELEKRQAALEGEQIQHQENADAAADSARPSAKLHALPRTVSRDKQAPGDEPGTAHS